MEEWGGTQQEKLAKLRDRMKSYYQAARPPCQVQKVTADMLWARTATAPSSRRRGQRLDTYYNLVFNFAKSIWDLMSTHS